MADETLDETASETEQPVEEAVAEAPVESPTPDAEPQDASPSAEQPSFATRTYAGKYQSADDLERAYLDSQREASRMAGELAALKKSPADSPTGEPKWKQLESERNKWAQHLRRADLPDHEKWQADEQVRLYDREIAYERAKHEFTQQSTRQQAEARLEQESLQVLNHYQGDLNNTQSALFQASADRYQQLIRAGYPDNINTKALAVAYAASLNGTNINKAVQTDRTNMLKTLNSAVKKAVVAGAGGPAPIKPSAISAQEIENMSDAEFAKYERKLLGV